MAVNVLRIPSQNVGSAKVVPLLHILVAPDSNSGYTAADFFFPVSSVTRCTHSQPPRHVIPFQPSTLYILRDLFDETLSFNNQKYLQSMVKHTIDIVTRGCRKLRNILHNSNQENGMGCAARKQETD